MTRPTLVLASTSPFRRMLLDKLRLPYQTCKPDVDETPEPEESPERLVQRLAEMKARAGARQFPEGLIIGSDQVAVIDDKILGKPGGQQQAVQQLRQASGRVVTFLTGLCLYDAGNDKTQTDVVPFRVHFRDLTAQQIEHYVAVEQPYQCAGSFKSEAFGITLFKKLEGDDPNALIGLPLIRLTEMLEQAGCPPL